MLHLLPNSNTFQAGAEDDVDVYSDGSFPLTMKGVDGDDSAHKRLMMLLSKKIIIVLADKYHTTKACPNYCNREKQMYQVFGNSTFTDRNGKIGNKLVHVLSHCK